MFSNDTINHHFILAKTSGDWNIDPCGEGKHPLGWLQQSVDAILHSWSFFHLCNLGLYHYCDEGASLPTLFHPSRRSHTPAISTLSQVIDDTSGLKLPSICNSQEENNINTNINFQLNCPIIPFCLPVDRTATQFIHVFRRDSDCNKKSAPRVCESVCVHHTLTHQFLRMKLIGLWQIAKVLSATLCFEVCIKKLTYVLHNYAKTKTTKMAT